ncbi:MAG TPA: aspartate aminotransferase family protein [Clostridiaceae bacterium]|jgi:acetylornithine/N-succinyldiaminopimelate aminotransferase|nr:aspartate aminotransferase family protein [Clostridiaceae bacterium]
MHLKEIIEMDKKFFMNTFGDRTPVCFKYGKGINLWDIDGNKYYDFLGGIAVNALGHSHPNLVNAIKTQAENLIHCSNLYYIESQAKLAKILAENSCADKVFFQNSGAEANEAAIKLARLYFRKKGLENKYEIITFKKSFHGRTITTIAATGQEKYHKTAMPLSPGFKMVPANDLEAIKAAVNENTAAIMVEAIQGEGGVNLIDREYIREVRKLCDEKGILMIFDEVQCGMGRTGKMFGFEHFDIEPEIFTLAKGLGGGFPIGAVCAKSPVAETFEPGDHGSTFGGNPLACSAAISVVQTILNEKLVKNAANVGAYFISKLGELSQKHGIISNIRGKGLMIGMEFNKEIAVEIKNLCFKEGYLVGNVGPNIIRILPPLILKMEDVDLFIDMFGRVLGKLGKE